MFPVFYSFRRCPYAMRARLALVQAQTQVSLREVVLRDKPQAFLDVSKSASVPCLVNRSETIDESLDIMIWALKEHDPEGWLDMPNDGWALIERCDGPFKDALDRTKYTTRYPDENADDQRAKALIFLAELEGRLTPWLFGRPTIADFAILPFVRQFALIDRPRFDAETGPHLGVWLDTFLNSAAFVAIMQKYPQWQPTDQPVLFPSNVDLAKS